MRKAIFLDRDGVINQTIVKAGKPYPPASLDELKLYNDTELSLKKLKLAGYLLIVVTNQPDVARGKTSRILVEGIHQALLSILPLDDILVCFHDDHDHCECRKPLPGLIFHAANSYKIDLKNSFMIGDRWKDIEAGQRAHCKTIWLDYAYHEPAPKIAPDFKTHSLNEATNWILQY